MKIDYVNLKKQWLSERKYLLPIIEKVLATGEFVGGSEIIKFEKIFLNLLTLNIQCHLIVEQML